MSDPVNDLPSPWAHYLTLNVERMDTGLLLVTSPDVWGLMVVGRDLSDLLARVPDAISELREARLLPIVPSATAPEARQSLSGTPDVVADPPAPEPPPNAPRAVPGGGR